MCDRRDGIGAAAAAALSDPERFDRAEPEPASDHLSVAEIAAALSRARGRDLPAPDMAVEEAEAAGMPPTGASHEWPNAVGQSARSQYARDLGNALTAFEEGAMEHMRADVWGRAPPGMSGAVPGRAPQGRSALPSSRFERHGLRPTRRRPRTPRSAPPPLSLGGRSRTRPGRTALMDVGTLFNLGLVLVFVLLGGVFAGTELALVSLRESQIRRLEKRGRRGAKVAAVARNPNRFLSAVQIGVTVTGFFSAAYGASTLAPDFAPLLVGAGLAEPLADGIALVALTLFVAYLSLVLGELVPKRFALQRAAGISLVVAPPLDRFATAMRPVIWLLSVSTDAVVRLFGGDPSVKREDVSREELREMVTDNADLATDEREIVADVFQAADRSLREVMRPRVEVEFLDADMEIAEAVSRVADRPYSRFPLKGEDIDDIVGFLHVRDLLSNQGGGGPLRDIMRPVPALPSTNKALTALGQMRDARTHIAVVVNEYGGTDGIVTLEDLVEELVGDIRDEHDLEGPPSGTGNGSGTYDAGLRLAEFAEQAGFALPEGPYETVGGLVMHRLGRIPAEGDAVTVEGRVIAVVQTSGNRTRLVEVAGPASEASGPSERP